MNVEGFEGNVLEGGTQFFLESDIPMITTEFVPEWIKEKGGDPNEFMRSFSSAGYSLQQEGDTLTITKRGYYTLTILQIDLKILDTPFQIPNLGLISAPLQSYHIISMISPTYECATANVDDTAQDSAQVEDTRSIVSFLTKGRYIIDSYP